VRGCAKLVKLAAAMLNELHAHLWDAQFQHALATIHDASPTAEDVQSNMGVWTRIPHVQVKKRFPRELLLALTVSGINGRRPFRPAIGHAG
jgi:hypothetical protein